MKSITAEKIGGRYGLIALLWSDEKPKGALEFKPGAQSCVMYPFAQVATRGKTAVFSAETAGCPGAVSGLGFGNGYYDAFGGAGVEFMSCFFSKGIASAADPVSYEERICHVPANERDKFVHGERFHASAGKAIRWMTEDLPTRQIPARYVVLKPLSEVREDEQPLVIVFITDALQLSGLITLVGAVTEGTDPVTAPPGAACQQIGVYAYREAEAKRPRAVLGFTDLAARKNIRKMFGDDLLTLAVPYSLFQKMEEEAEDGVFDGPIWRDLVEDA